MSYKIKNLYIGKYESGILIVKDMKADQELLRVNNVSFKTTYDIKEDLKKYGFKFNEKKKEWLLKDGDITVLDEIKKKYLVDRETYEIRFKKQCEMCGSYYYKKCDCDCC